MVQNDSSQSQALPLVSISLWTAHPEKFGASPEELAYGENLSLLSGPVLDIRCGLNTTGLLVLLKDGMRKLKPPPSAYHAENVVNLPRDLPCLN